MRTEIIKINKNNRKKVLKKSAEVIKKGGLVVFPTETVYGLGANALDEKALKKIFKAKGRPSDNPIIVHIGEKKQLADLVENISPDHKKLMNAFWPGPLSIIFKKKDNISDILSGGLPTIAVRMPANKVAKDLIKYSGVPIAAPSANISGRPSGTKGEHIYDELKGKVSVIIESGFSDIGLESTVVKVEKGKVLILRPGKITKEMLGKVLGPRSVSLATRKKDLKSSPGTRYRHYAPEALLEILSGKNKMLEKGLNLKKKGKKVGIITVTEDKKYFNKFLPDVFVIGGRNNLKEISKNLYHALRFFDTRAIDMILCPSFTEKGLGMAIMDRLKRASKK